MVASQRYTDLTAFLQFLFLRGDFQKILYFFLILLIHYKENLDLTEVMSIEAALQLPYFGKG